MLMLSQDLVEEWAPVVTHIILCVHTDTDTEDIPTLE